MIFSNIPLASVELTKNSSTIFVYISSSLFKIYKIFCINFKPLLVSDSLKLVSRVLLAKAYCITSRTYPVNT